MRIWDYLKLHWTFAGRFHNLKVTCFNAFRNQGSLIDTPDWMIREAIVTFFNQIPPGEESDALTKLYTSASLRIVTIYQCKVVIAQRFQITDLNCDWQFQDSYLEFRHFAENIRTATRLGVRPDEFQNAFTGKTIGDLGCAFNARSPYLRCAINPTGPCEDCQYYQARE